MTRSQVNMKKSLSAILSVIMVSFAVLSAGSPAEAAISSTPSTGNQNTSDSSNTSNTSNTSNSSNTSNTSNADTRKLRLGESPESFTIEIEGIVYALPIKFSEMMKDGWKVIGEVESNGINPRYSSEMNIEKGEKQLRVVFSNPKGDADFALDNISVFSIGTVPNPMKAPMWRLPGNISSKTTVTDIILKYGFPTGDR